jgi:hypothetical protein
MRIKWLLLYWLAVAATGAIAFFVPYVGWAFGAGAFAYLLAAIPGWLLMGGFFAHMENRNTTFGIDNRRFGQLLAGAGVLACGAGLASGLHWLAWGGAGLLYLGGEWLVVDRMFRERAGRTAS